MNKNIAIAIGVVVLVIIGAFVYSSMKEKKSEETVKEVLNQDDGKKMMDGEDKMMKESAFTGKAMLTKEQTKIAWTGKKTLVAGYKDTGSIQIQSGEVEFMNGKVKSAKVVIDMNTITALTTGGGDGQDKLSQHLKSTDFFDAGKYPTATFNLTEATETTKDSGNYIFKGTLNMKGIEAPVSFPGQVKVSGNTANLQTNFDLDRTTWGANFGSSKVADSFIDDKFNLQMNVNVNLK